VARWLITQGFHRVSVLEGGLGAWREAGLPTDTIEGAVSGAAAEGVSGVTVSDAQASFLPSLADRYLRGGGLPTRRRLATLFVDIAGSTRLLAHHPPETVLAVVQRFMRLVTEVALAYCGDVKDFEGDGALLYFESTAEAARAALAIRAALARGTCDGVTRVAARMSLTVGDVIVGVIGSTMRQAIGLVGPSVNVGSRLLKQVQPGGIIATGEVVEALRIEAPDMVAEFQLLDPAFEVPASDGITVEAYVIR
jgi:class 3 adenylate cyclase